MSDDDNEDVTLSLKVMINREKGKVLFAEADSHFADILISFLTLPLGRILKILEKHYGEEAPAIGSLSKLYRSIANLETSRFVTKGARRALLNPTSSFEAEYQRLELDITDSSPPVRFLCSASPYYHSVLHITSMYYDHPEDCKTCGKPLSKQEGTEWNPFASAGGVFIMNTAPIIISDDFRILPNESGVFGIIAALGIMDMDEAEPIHVDLGYSEIIKLLKASLTSPTPLSDVVLNKTTPMKYYAITEPQPKIHKEETPDLTLLLMVQRSEGKVLYAQADKKFVEFLFSILHIPVGGVDQNLLGSKTCFKAINNLCRSTADLLEGEHSETSKTKRRIMKANLVHGCISDDPILPLTEERLPRNYDEKCIRSFTCHKFPKGKGNYLQGPQTYLVADDLSVEPFRVVTVLSSLRKQKIPLYDVEQVEMKIGPKEALSILKAALVSTSALTDALISRTSNKHKRPKTEPRD